MKIVINISEEKYGYVTDDCWCGPYWIQQIIKNGTPLPKGHGRLIDADELLAHLNDWAYTGTPYKTPDKVKEFTAKDMQRMVYRTIRESMTVIDNAPAIIEADGGEE